MSTRTPVRPAGPPPARRPAPLRAPVRPADAAVPEHVAVRAALTAGAAAVLGMWWLGTSGGTTTGLGGWVTSVGRVTGLLGGYLVLVQVLLLARLPWFERAVGLDRLTAWHRGLGTSVVSLLSVHVLLIVEGYALTDRHATLSEGWTVLSTYPAMLRAAAGLALFLLVGATSGRRIRPRLSYEAWYWLHLTAYVAVGLTFFHQVSAGADFRGSDPRRLLARLVWTAMYLAVAGAVLWWRVVRPVRGWFRHRMVVDRVVREADGVVSVWVRGHDLTAIGGRAGQFLLWRFATAGHLWTAHPYSLSAPSTATSLRVTVKDAGDHSGALAGLRPGVPVLAEGPFGHFTSDAVTRDRTLLVAGGSGIGPVRALAEDLASRQRLGGQHNGRRRPADLTVLYRVSDARDLALAGELDDLAADGLLRVRHLVGRRADLRYDPLSAASLSDLVPDVAERDVFVCGPAGMTATVLRSLDQLRVPARQVHVEEFSTS